MTPISYTPIQHTVRLRPATIDEDGYSSYKSNSCSVGYEIVHVRFPSVIRRRTVSAGIYILLLVPVLDMMSRPSNTRSSGGLCLGENCLGKVHVNLGRLLSSLSLSLSLSSLMCAGAGGAVGGGGVQWF